MNNSKFKNTYLFFTNISVVFKTFYSVYILYILYCIYYIVYYYILYYILYCIYCIYISIYIYKRQLFQTNTSLFEVSYFCLFRIQNLFQITVKKVLISVIRLVSSISITCSADLVFCGLSAFTAVQVLY